MTPAWSSSSRRRRRRRSMDTKPRRRNNTKHASRSRSIQRRHFVCLASAREIQRGGVEIEIERVIQRHRRERKKERERETESPRNTDQPGTG